MENSPSYHFTIQADHVLVGEMGNARACVGWLKSQTHTLHLRGQGRIIEPPVAPDIARSHKLTLAQFEEWKKALAESGWTLSQTPGF
jgi:hypothetical protein